MEKPKPKLPTPRSHTPRSMTPKSMTPKSMTPKSMTPKSMTPKSMTPKSMTPKSMTPKMTPESPRKSRMGPKKSALAQVSASQDEEESSLNESDLVPTNKGKFLYLMYFWLNHILARMTLLPETLWPERQFGQCHFGW